MFASFLAQLEQQFMPHGACYLWDGPMLFLQVGSDSLIALAYYMIAATLLYFVLKRSWLPYPWMFLLFAAFIFACGTTHIMEIWTVWRPSYWLQGLIKTGTAGVSLVTAVLLIPLIPKLLALPSSQELAATIQALERETADRKAAEKELAEERRFLRAVLDSVNAGIVACDENNELVFINRAIRKLHALGPEAGPPQSLPRGKQLYSPEGGRLTGDELPLSRALRGEVFENLEVVIRPEHAPPRFVLMNGQPIVDESERKLGAVVAVHDITDRKRLQSELLSAKKLESLGRLAGGVAHDFNNVLTAIQGYAEQAMNTNDGKRVREHLTEVRKATERATALTSQLLAVSRKQVIQPQTISLNEVVTDLTKMLLRLIREDIELEVRPAGQLDYVRADPGQVSQVLINLVVNASDAMPFGGTLTIETANRTFDALDQKRYPALPPGAYVMLSVSDTGVGLVDEATTRLFEPFFTTKEVGKGTGLGLATTRDIIISAGGHIFFTTAAGEGTRFELLLPRVDAAPAPASTPREAEPPKRGAETVLVVEDEAPLRDLISGALSGLGYRVEAARDGNEALQLLRDRASAGFDLLVTDVIVPHKSGKEIADAARSSIPGIKVLFVSGYTDDAISHHGVLEPGVEFLPKPFSLEDLARKVREVLDAEPPT